MINGGHYRWENHIFHGDEQWNINWLLETLVIDAEKLEKPGNDEINRGEPA